ncbi:MAG TPA: hypothetical protein PLL33_11250 [Paracoccus sp. (in: a-proteobacteria)]|nr:hypothetical protein [Paracoccus sp. (in: a-proteobacteria)]
MTTVAASCAAAAMIAVRRRHVMGQPGRVKPVEQQGRRQSEQHDHGQAKENLREKGEPDHVLKHAPMRA